MTPFINAFKQQQLPSWASSKVARLAAGCQKTTEYSSLGEALSELEFESATVLRAELTAFPDLATSVPADFLRLLKQNAINAMRPIECAALVIIEADAQALTPARNPDGLAEFTALKWRALGSLLQEVENAI